MLNYIPKDELYTIINSLAQSHLGQAIDSMRRSYDLELSKDGFSKMAAHQNAISSIMHGFCFLESLLNSLGYELLFNKESSEYILEENRDYPLKKLSYNWNTLRALDKLDFLMQHLYNKNVNEKYKNKLIEINNLRNMLMHGVSYTTTLLLEPNGENSWLIHDQEDSINWNKKFNQNKFNSLVNIDYTDSKKVLTVILEICKPFYMESMGLSVTTIYPNGNYQAFIGENIDFTDLLELPQKVSNKTLKEKQGDT